MTQRLTTTAVERCLGAHVVALIRESGTTTGGALLGIDRGTAARWRDQPDPELVTAHAVAAVLVAQVHETGESRLVSDLAGLVSGAAPVGRGEEADRVCLQALVDLGEALAEDGRALANGHVDLTEARRLLPLLRRARQLAAQAEVILADKLTRGVQ